MAKKKAVKVLTKKKTVSAKKPAPSKSIIKKAKGKKVAVKKPTAKKVIAKIPAVKKSAAKKATTKIAVLKKVPAKKIVLKKVTPLKKAVAVKAKPKAKSSKSSLPANVKPVQETVKMPANNNSVNMIANSAITETNEAIQNEDPVTTFDKHAFEKATAKGDPHSKLQLNSNSKGSIRPSGKKPLWRK